ncbi:hypothetical protein PQR67_34795, partial [Paraburkholderia fungorum]|uniref:hypothetical protein n=1 Tax=Paraburkholderia fungorum TaxID=134537 RepID=UPI0038B711C7
DPKFNFATASKSAQVPAFQTVASAPEKPHLSQIRRKAYTDLNRSKSKPTNNIRDNTVLCDAC